MAKHHIEELEAKKRMVIIDGNNVAFGHLNGKMFSVKGLDLCIKYFKRLGHEVTAVVPQFRLKKHQSTDYVLLEKLNRDGDVTLAPSKNLPGQCSSTYDDRLILSIAEQFDGVIISNDNFRDLLEISTAWRRIIETRVIGYTWVKDCFFLPDDPYGRYGPTLQQILNGKSV
uniref:RNase_Zc3h12a domain-containing protein n=1 Tax=Anopheles maculatus TaxID=74869 RepID=A0A182SJ12_9DIPT